VCDSSSLFYYFLFFKKRKKKERKLFDITGTLGSHVVLWVSYLGDGDVEGIVHLWHTGTWFKASIGRS